jgi:hypothetical protein
MPRLAWQTLPYRAAGHRRVILGSPLSRFLQPGQAGHDALDLDVLCLHLWRRHVGLGVMPCQQCAARVRSCDRRLAVNYHSCIAAVRGTYSGRTTGSPRTAVTLCAPLRSSHGGNWEPLVRPKHLDRLASHNPRPYERQIVQQCRW